MKPRQLEPTQSSTASVLRSQADSKRDGHGLHRPALVVPEGVTATKRCDQITGMLVNKEKDQQKQRNRSFSGLVSADDVAPRTTGVAVRFCGEDVVVEDYRARKIDVFPKSVTPGLPLFLSQTAGEVNHEAPNVTVRKRRSSI